MNILSEVESVIEEVERARLCLDVIKILSLKERGLERAHALAVKRQRWEWAHSLLMELFELRRDKTELADFLHKSSAEEDSRSPGQVDGVTPSKPDSTEA